MHLNSLATTPKELCALPRRVTHNVGRHRLLQSEEHAQQLLHHLAGRNERGADEVRREGRAVHANEGGQRRQQPPWRRHHRRGVHKEAEALLPVQHPHDDVENFLWQLLRGGGFQQLDAQPPFFVHRRGYTHGWLLVLFLRSARFFFRCSVLTC